MVMKYVKTWRYDGLPTEHDIEYAESLGCKVVVHDKVKIEELVGPDGKIYQYAWLGFYGLEFTTENSRQESALLLKYGDYLDHWSTEIL
jgi:hypothetical protein